MKITESRIIALTSSLLASLSFGAEAPPPEVVWSRARYEAALAAAAKPVKDKYISELQQLKNRAMSLKNLELAVAIDQELKAIGAQPATDATAAADTIAGFEHRLIGTKWTWNGTFPIEFEPNGKSTGKGLTWKTTKPYTIEYSFPDANHGTIVFERSIAKATINEVTNSGKKNPMSLFRIKE